MWISLNFGWLSVNFRQSHILCGWWWLRWRWSWEGHVRRVVTGIVRSVRHLWCVRGTGHHPHSTAGWPELLHLRLRHEAITINCAALGTVALGAGRVHWWRWVRVHLNLSRLIVVHHRHLTTAHLPRWLFLAWGKETGFSGVSFRLMHLSIYLRWTSRPRRPPGPTSSRGNRRLACPPAVHLCGRLGRSCATSSASNRFHCRRYSCAGM